MRLTRLPLLRHEQRGQRCHDILDGAHAFQHFRLQPLVRHIFELGRAIEITPSLLPIALNQSAESTHRCKMAAGLLRV